MPYASRLSVVRTRLGRRNQKVAQEDRGAVGISAESSPRRLQRPLPTSRPGLKMGTEDPDLSPSETLAFFIRQLQLSRSLASIHKSDKDEIQSISNSGIFDFDT